MMKKILSLFLVMSFLLSVYSVFAVDQNVTVNVVEQIIVSISPSSLDFGSIIPGNSQNSTEDITINPAGSNSNVKVDISGISDAIFSNIELKETSDTTWTSIGSYPDIDFVCTGSPCNYTSKTLDARLTVPPGTTVGTKTGTITYTITGSAPL